jgi:biotin carboxylase
MPQKTLLIVGAGPDQLPAIQKAKHCGYRVLAIDRNPEAVGFRHADGHALISTNDKDAALRYARDNAIDAILTLVSETGVPVVAHVNQALGLPGTDVRLAHLATNKIAMRDALRAHGCPMPDYAGVGHYQDALHFMQGHELPIVIKPSDSSGQNGVTKITGEEQLEAAFAEAVSYASDGLAIVEEFFAGVEINITAIVNRGEIEILSLSERVTAEPPHFGIATHHVAPPALNDEQTARVKQAAICSIEAIGMRDGIAYPQVLVNGNQVSLVEIAARIPGGHMREVALYRSGIDMVDVAIHQATGTGFELDEVRVNPAFPAVVAEFLTALNTLPEGTLIQRVAGFEEVNAMDGIRFAYCHLKPGERIPALTSSRARFGVVFAAGGSVRECRDLIAKARSVIEIEGD